jgi:transposase
MKTRRNFDKEFKLMTVELCNTGKSSNQVSKELGIRPDLVRRWRRELETKQSGSFTGHGHPGLTPEQQEISNLKKQLQEAELERDILKKAVGIFSKSGGKYLGS